jgi:hypothetical protein
MKPWNEFHVREYRAQELADLLKMAFGDVRIRGLFAVEELYRVEFERCQRALQIVRSGNAPRRRSLAERGRDSLASLAKAFLPSSAIDYIRACRTPVAAELDPLVIEKYSTRDLFYRTDNLDEALDLMATCRMT